MSDKSSHSCTCGEETDRFERRIDGMEQKIDHLSEEMQGIIAILRGAQALVFVIKFTGIIAGVWLAAKQIFGGKLKPTNVLSHWPAISKRH